MELHGIYEAIHCAEILSDLNYRAMLLTDQKTTMPILWVAHDDHDAVASARRVLGREPIILFGANRSVGGEASASGDQVS